MAQRTYSKRKRQLTTSETTINKKKTKNATQ